MTITHPCKFCGQPVTAEIPDDLDGATVKALTGLFEVSVHDHCGAAAEASFLAKHRAAESDLREQRWPIICPPEYLGTDHARLPQSALSDALAWQPGGKGLLLVGPSRAGKTRIAYEGLKRQHMAGLTISAHTHTKLARRIQAESGKGHYELTSLLRTLRTADILFIDDLGKAEFLTSGGGSRRSEELLFDLIDHRFSSRLACWFTTNMTGTEIAARMSPDRGVPFVERLREFTTKVSVLPEARRSDQNSPTTITDAPDRQNAS